MITRVIVAIPQGAGADEDMPTRHASLSSTNICPTDLVTKGHRVTNHYPLLLIGIIFSYTRLGRYMYLCS